MLVVEAWLHLCVRPGDAVHRGRLGVGVEQQGQRATHRHHRPDLQQLNASRLIAKASHPGLQYRPHTTRAPHCFADDRERQQQDRQDQREEADVDRAVELPRKPRAAPHKPSPVAMHREERVLRKRQRCAEAVGEFVTFPRLCYP